MRAEIRAMIDEARAEMMEREADEPPESEPGFVVVDEAARDLYEGDAVSVTRRRANRPRRSRLVLELAKPAALDHGPRALDNRWRFASAGSLISCTKCHGVGSHLSRGSRIVGCACVARSVFEIVMDRYRRAGDPFALRCELRRSGVAFSRPSEEFRADVELLARRLLSEKDLGVFRLFEIEDRDWRFCCRVLRIDRGTFFHAVYRVREILGRAFVETEPFPLFPLDQYFSCRPAALRPAPDSRNKPKISLGLFAA